MSNTREQNQARRHGLVATIMFVLLVGMGYAVASQVEGAVALPEAVEDQDGAYFPSECVVDGLVFSACLQDL